MSHGPGPSTPIGELRKFFAGEIVEPGQPSYEQVRRVHNGLIDKRPAVVARCLGSADVSEAVKYARSMGLEIAVRGGGHNVAGRATCDGGLVVDLSLMRDVHVNPQGRIAWAGGGARWKDFNRETQQFGLATTGGVVSTTGVAGLTLGGGFGWLMPKHGMALDNLRSVQLVLADGTIARASADTNPDLFWAVRGGGGNFGVAIALEFQLHPVGPMVTGGLVAHPAPRARDVLRFFRDQTEALPDEMFLVCAMLTAPDGSGAKIVGVAAQHSGSLEAGEAALAPIKAFGPPVMDMMGPLPYVASNMLLDDAFPASARNYWKSHFLTDLSDAAIDVLVDRFESLPTPMSQIVVEHFHGAAARVPADATAFGLRASGYNVLFVSEWLDPADDDRCIKWCRDTYQAITPFVSPLRYMNYMNADDCADAEASLRAAYGANVPKLRQIKRKYDPDNVFRLNLNIPPA